MKKVLHISYDNIPGAGQVPVLIHTEMKKRGHYSRFLVHGRNAKKEEHLILYYNLFEVFLHKIRLGINKIFSLYGVRKYLFFNINEERNFIPAENILRKIKFIPDIIIFYWTSRFVNTRTISDLYKKTKAQIFWVMTDMGAYTGGCHYAWGCKGFESSCANCPALMDGYKAIRNLEIKKNQLKDIPMTIVASPGDSIDYVRQSQLFRNKNILEHILKVNTSHFTNFSKVEARRRFNLEKSDIVLFTGANFKDERKGLSFLKQSLKILSELVEPGTKARICIVYSSKSYSNIFNTIPFRRKSLGYLDLADQLPLAFLAADAFLSSSIMETGPYMVNLSIAYGCPIISFDVGVAKELVINGQTGFKSAEISSHSYAITIKKFLDLNEKDSGVLSARCKKLAQEKLQWKESSLAIYGL